MRSDHSIPVLMYHSIADVMTDGFREFTVTPARFAEHLAALRTAGWRTVTLTEALRLLRQGPSPGGDRVVALTFDDALADFHACALPLLYAEHAEATLFVPTAYIGGTARWLAGADASRPVLGWKALAEVAAAGVEIGSHGHLHAPLDLGDRDDLYRDLSRSRLTLEDHLGVEITTLAFPFGYQTPKSREAARRAGYQAACAVVGLPATTREPILALPRLAVWQDMTGADLVHAIGRRYTSWERSWLHGKQYAWSAARKTGLIGPKGISRERRDVARHPPEGCSR